MTYTFKTSGVFVFHFVVDFENVIVAHASKDYQAYSTKGAFDLEGEIILLFGLDLVYYIIEILAGNEDNDDQSCEK